MKSPVTNPVHWRLVTLLKMRGDALDHLARSSVATLTSYRLVVGRCLLAFHQTKAYKKYGCSSAIHYAASVLGMHPREARTCRRVADKLQGLPKLTLAAELGKIPWAKLREIIRKASVETEEFWLRLAPDRSYKEIEMLVRRTPFGSLPGEVDLENQSCGIELRCSINPEVFSLLEHARRTFSQEQGEAVTNAQVLEWALTSYLANQSSDPDTLEKVRQDIDKDHQAELARQLPLVSEARELAQELGLLPSSEGNAESDLLEDVLNNDQLNVPPGSGCSSISVPAPSFAETEHISRALGLLDNESLTWAACYNEGGISGKRPARVIQDHDFPPTWQNPRLRFSPDSRHTTKAQKKEIRRRDGWCCKTPGCPHNVWIELHHLRPFSEGGKTEPVNLLSLCSGCHRNVHRGHLQISEDRNGTLVFRDNNGRRLDRQADLELAGWLDFWTGWVGKDQDSHTAKTQCGNWSVFSEGPVPS